ncbi:MAG: hypothetical protein HY774_20710 [Acidobacteria bacterium]|nr:hypothetical protein [Acidobacteriota bacterium]
MWVPLKLFNLLAILVLLFSLQTVPLPKEHLNQSDLENPVLLAKKATEWQHDALRKQVAKESYKLAASLRIKGHQWSVIAKCYGGGLLYYPTSKEMILYIEASVKGSRSDSETVKQNILESIKYQLAGAIAVDLAVPQLSIQERRQIEQDLACLNSYLAQPNRTAVSDCKYVKMIYSQE